MANALIHRLRFSISMETNDSIRGECEEHEVSTLICDIPTFGYSLFSLVPAPAIEGSEPVVSPAVSPPDDILLVIIPVALLALLALLT